MTALLEVDGLTKAYPGVVANADVSFAIRPGEIHALLGENGAGKSTLVKAIYGLVKPDRGRMRLNGSPHAPTEPRAARAAGVISVLVGFGPDGRAVADLEPEALLHRFEELPALVDRLLP